MRLGIVEGKNSNDIIMIIILREGGRERRKGGEKTLYSIYHVLGIY